MSRDSVPPSGLESLRRAPGQHVRTLIRDVRYTWRSYSKRPFFALTAILTLALGTGAIASLFAVVNAVLLRPLPYKDPERLALVWAQPPEGTRTWLSPPEISDLAERATALESIAGLTDLRLVLTTGGEPEELQVVGASASLFPMLGVDAALGRLFDSSADTQAAADVVLLSHALWQRRFGGSPQAVGSVITLNGRPYTIAGVMPASFGILPPSSVFPARVDAWVPLQRHLQARTRDIRFVHALARLDRGVTLAQAQEELAATGAALSRDFPSDYRGGAWTFTAVGLQEDVLRGVRPALVTLFWVGAAVLLLACTNVAALLVARGESRRREMAIRVALGASRGRVAGQLFTEGFVLAAAGGLAGLAIAAITPLAGSIPALAALPRFTEISVDWRLFAFVAAISVGTAMVFAAAPAIELPAGAARMQETLRTIARGRYTTRTLRVLAVAQIALASLVLCLALAMTRQLATLMNVDAGFSPDRVLTFRLTLGPPHQNGAAAARFIEGVVGRLADRPDVEAAGAVTQLPFSGAALGSSFSRDAASREPLRVDADLRGTTPDYFRAMAIRLVDGRGVNRSDAAGTPPVAVVDELFAARMWPGQRAVGQTFEWFRQPGVRIEVVGVAAAVRHRGYGEPARETVYRPHAQYPRSTMYVVMKTRIEPSALGAAVAEAVRAIDPQQPVTDLMPMDARTGQALAQPAVGAALSGCLALLALTLTVVGVYGVLAFVVALRQRELGVRLALGATSRQVVSLVVRDCAVLTLAGVTAGIGAVFALGGTTALLPGASGVDLRIALAAAAVVTLAALAGCFLPAARAGRLQPSLVLRAE